MASPRGVRDNEKMSRVLGFFGLLSVLTGCGGTDVGNGRSIKLELQGYEDPAFTQSQSLTLESGVHIESLFVSVDRISFEPAVNGSCADRPELEDVDLPGPVVANLVGEGVLGGAPVLSDQDAALCEFEFRYQPLELADAPEGTPAALDGLSLRMTGERADGSAFVVESRLGEELELEARDGVPFGVEEGNNAMLLSFELSTWVEALALDGLTGPVLINEDENQDRLERFEEAVKRSARLLRDVDGDGDVDIDERAEGAELAD